MKGYDEIDSGNLRSRQKKGKFPPERCCFPRERRPAHLYILAEGRIEVLRGSTQVAVVSEPGSVFGEMSVLLNTPHTATVRALSPVTVYAYANAAGFMRSDPQIAFVIARLLAQRLNLATTYLADLKRQYAGQGNHLGHGERCACQPRSPAGS